MEKINATWLIAAFLVGVLVIVSFIPSTSSPTMAGDMKPAVDYVIQNDTLALDDVSQDEEKNLHN